ncbi:metalloprotease [Yersinia rohdei]|uniref:M10 family metallopeptidase C-terminal domain-containing protein n=1 Tax=Yersinia rohdei TaxID=29485 RepID=UPI00061CB1AA|nr:M10 family metallopeptidase C-terminal domain-containing protein [Yersinia rohdei]CNE48079.1 metalloprotease [Yersinia rohdei]
MTREWTEIGIIAASNINTENITTDNTNDTNIINSITNEKLSEITPEYTFGDKTKITNKIFYSFSQSYSLWESDITYQQDAPIFPFNQQQIRQAKLAMQSCADAANIHFMETSQDNPANLLFLNYEQQDVTIAGYAYYPGQGDFSPLWINFAHCDAANPTQTSYSALILTHELGHTLGLKHTHNPDSYTQQVSVMSYLSEQSSDADYLGHHPSTPQMLDIAALQYLYGANPHTRLGNTTYGFNSNSSREYLTANNASDILIFCVWDAGGIDTFDFSGYKQNQTINLNQLSFSDIGGLKGNISIAADVIIENAIGGDGDDNIKGNKADNRLTGGGGADQLWGNQGYNTFVYQSVSDSLTTAADTLHDFNVDKDKIDLSALTLDSNKTRLVDKFSFGGDTEIMQHYDDIRDMTYLMIDFDNQVHENDMLIKLTGNHQLSCNNFILSPSFTA